MEGKRGGEGKKEKGMEEKEKRKERESPPNSHFRLCHF